jgi:GntR family transcriptional regulator
MLEHAALTINKRLPTPAYLQLKDKLTQAIENGTLSVGSALPSERELADDLGLSRMTVRRAFEALVAEKRVEQRQGSGTYILGRTVEQRIDRVLGFTDEAANLGVKAGSVLLETQHLMPDPVIAKALQLKLNSSPSTISLIKRGRHKKSSNHSVLCITRLRTADGEPLALQTAYLAPHLSTLSLQRLAKKGSLYKTIEEQFGVKPQGAKQSVSARLPNEQECNVLNINSNTPVLALERTTFDKEGKAFEFVRSSYRGDRYVMLLDLRAP